VRRLFDNLGAAVVGYIAASVAAGIAIILIMVVSNLFLQLTDPTYIPSEQTLAEQLRGLLFFGVLALLIVATTALVPAVPVIAVLLLARRTDIISCIVAGIAISVFAVMIAGHSAFLMVLFMERLQVNWLTVTAGAVAGVAFWAVLGKMAPRQPASAP
jgi:hypothetical protein